MTDDSHVADGALVLGAQAGSSAAFAKLIDSHQRAVRAFLRRMCGNAAEADDLAQETFVSAWVSIRRCRPDLSFRAWLYGIAYRKFLAERRARGRRMRRETVAVLDETTTDPAAKMDVALDIERALQALPPDQRAAVALCLAAEMSHAEVAKAMRLPLGTVKSHVQRGRARLLVVLRSCNG